MSQNQPKTRQNDGQLRRKMTAQFGTKKPSIGNHWTNLNDVGTESSKTSAKQIDNEALNTGTSTPRSCPQEVAPGSPRASTPNKWVVPRCFAELHQGKYLGGGGHVLIGLWPKGEATVLHKLKAQ